MDKKIEEKISRISRAMSRRNFVKKTMASFAGIIAVFVLGPFAKNISTAFAATATCSPPNQGTYCGGCHAGQACPAGYELCTSTNSSCDDCIYSRGYWYVGYMDQYMCADCKPVGTYSSCDRLCGCKVPMYAPAR